MNFEDEVDLKVSYSKMVVDIHNTKIRVASLEELVAAQDKTIQDLKQQISYQLTKERQLKRDLSVGKKRG